MKNNGIVFCLQRLEGVNGCRSVFSCAVLLTATAAAVLKTAATYIIRCPSGIDEYPVRTVLPKWGSDCLFFHKSPNENPTNHGIKTPQITELKSHKSRKNIKNL